MTLLKQYLPSDILNYCLMDYIVGSKKYWKGKYNYVIQDEMKFFIKSTNNMIDFCKQQGIPVHPTYTFCKVFLLQCNSNIRNNDYSDDSDSDVSDDDYTAVKQ